jgi:hypothetical protein
MENTRKLEILHPIGGVDTDSDFKNIRKPNYRTALNIRNRYGSITPIKGNEACPATLPSGTNTCIGSVESRQTKSLVYFLHNSLGNHSIWEYFPYDDSSPCGRTIKLVEGSFLNFSIDRHIHSAKVVDGRYLIIPDAIDFDGVLEGNQPWMIDKVRANDTDKNIQYELSFNDFTIGETFNIEVEDIDGNTILASTLFYTSTTTDAAVEIPAIVAALNAFGSHPFTASANERSITLESDDTERRISITTSVNTVYLYPVNSYSGFTEDLMAAYVVPVPYNSPVATMRNDTSIKTNDIFGNSFKFRYRYVFRDGSPSAWGPSSVVPTNLITSGTTFIDNNKYFNSIRLTIDDDRIFGNDNWREYIERIEIAVAFSDTDTWKFYDDFLVRDIHVDQASAYFDFNNSRVYLPIASDAASTAEQQALKNYDFLPRRIAAIEGISDDEGDYIMAIGGLLEDYEVDVSPDVTLSLQGHALNSPAIGDQTSILKGLKTGGVYGVGIVYEDEAGRQANVVKTGKIRVGWGQTAAIYPNLRAVISHDPPSFASRYRLCLGKNENQSIYVQIPSYRAVYWILDGDQDATSTTYAAGDATHVGFEFLLSDLDDGSLRNYIFEVLKENEKFFIPEQGDRIHMVNWSGPVSPNPINVDDYDYEIVGYSLTYPSSAGSSIDRFTIFIEFNTNQPNWQFSAGGDFVLCEIYKRSKAIVDNIFYEIGDSHPISGGVHSLTTIDLTDIGDAYNTSREYTNNLAGGGPHTINVPWVQRAYLHRNTLDIASDLGRPVVYDPNRTEQYNYSRIRSSGVYAANSTINGLRSFAPTEYIRVNRDFDAIMSLVLVDKVLLAIMKLKTQAFYISKGELIDLSGNTLVGRTDKLLNIADEYQKDWGTQHPATVAVDDGRVYAFDAYKGIMWRYTTGGGQVDIGRYGKSNFFFALGKTYIEDPRNLKVIGGIEREHTSYYIKFGSGYAVGFQEGFPDDQQSPKWVGDYEFEADFFGKVGLLFVSWKNGDLWVHDSDNVPYSELYGIQRFNKIGIIANDIPNAVKLWFHAEQVSTSLWYAEYIKTPPNGNYPNGMESKLIPNKWTGFEGQYKADFLRDMSDDRDDFQSINPNPLDPTRRTAALLRGRRLRGEAIRIDFVLVDQGAYSELTLIKLHYVPSEATS